MDRDPDATGGRRSGVLDDVLRRITDEEGRRGRVGFHFPLGVHMRYAICIHFLISNNVAEYEALVNGLSITIELGIQWLDVRDNSQLVIDQVMKESSCHNVKMAAYCHEVR